MNYDAICRTALATPGLSKSKETFLSVIIPQFQVSSSWVVLPVTVGGSQLTLNGPLMGTTWLKSQHVKQKAKFSLQ